MLLFLFLYFLVPRPPLFFLDFLLLAILHFLVFLRIYKVKIIFFWNDADDVVQRAPHFLHSDDDFCLPPPRQLDMGIQEGTGNNLADISLQFV